ncbi:MAG: acyl--CoA ligase [Dehalococcoidia bacterium]|tara:strand:+ start:2183 stop:3676 length:1494 start_codon:yes stop_codon:yes gene_type:complete
MSTLANILSNRPKDDLCVVVPNGVQKTYGQFHDEVERVAEILSASGVKKGRTVSIVLPNGLEFMIVFLAVTRSGAIAAPLNSAYTKDEFKFYMEDTESQLVIIKENAKIAIEAANELNIEIASVKINSDEKLEIQKNGTNLTKSKSVAAPDEKDIALFLHTSGTTSRPKGVPLTHKNLMTSLSNISKTYLLNGDDTALVVMPLFHVHGLIGVALSSLFSGGTIVIPERFSASTFWQDRLDYNATWFSAVPTIHQILLMRANDDNAPSKSFRLIRSCSSALAPSVFDQLENRFGAPVLEAYGMTEASHQMSSNLLPPGSRSPGTVGIGTGVDISIMDESGNLLSYGQTGEVVIKGSNVTKGYHNNPDANAEAFTNGWFRTGDQGQLSVKDVLTLTGRLKELINRGGEKISPLEVDAALIQHPLISEAVSFGIQDEKYGEIVQAAVVLSGEISETDIQAYCSKHIADFKIPSKIFVVQELPRTATGKIQRRHVAAKFSN